jgi:hypothetical protein
MNYISEYENYEGIFICCQVRIIIDGSFIKIVIVKNLINVQESGVQGKTRWHVFPAPCMQEVGASGAGHASQDRVW